MAFDLPPGYQPSADEEFMNPKQVEYFRQRLEEARTDLRRELDAMPPRDADDLGREGIRLTKPVRTRSENLRSKTASGSRCCCGKLNEL